MSALERQEQGTLGRILRQELLTATVEFPSIGSRDRTPGISNTKDFAQLTREIERPNLEIVGCADKQSVASHGKHWCYIPGAPQTGSRGRGVRRPQDKPRSRNRRH